MAALANVLVIVFQFRREFLPCSQCAQIAGTEQIERRS